LDPLQNVNLTKVRTIKTAAFETVAFGLWNSDQYPMSLRFLQICI